MIIIHIIGRIISCTIDRSFWSLPLLNRLLQAIASRFATPCAMVKNPNSTIDANPAPAERCPYPGSNLLVSRISKFVAARTNQKIKVTGIEQLHFFNAVFVLSLKRTQKQSNALTVAWTYMFANGHTVSMRSNRERSGKYNIASWTAPFSIESLFWRIFVSSVTESYKAMYYFSCADWFFLSNGPIRFIQSFAKGYASPSSCN